MVGSKAEIGVHGSDPPIAIVGSRYPAGDPGSGCSELAVRTGPDPVSRLIFVNVSGPNTNLTPVPTRSLIVTRCRMPIVILTVCACNGGLKVASRHSVCPKWSWSALTSSG